MHRSVTDEWGWAREGEGHQRQREEHIEGMGVEIVPGFVEIANI